MTVDAGSLVRYVLRAGLEADREGPCLFCAWFRLLILLSLDGVRSAPSEWSTDFVCSGILEQSITVRYVENHRAAPCSTARAGPTIRGRRRPSHASPSQSLIPLTTTLLPSLEARKMAKASFTAGLILPWNEIHDATIAIQDRLASKLLLFRAGFFTPAESSLPSILISRRRFHDQTAQRICTCAHTNHRAVCLFNVKAGALLAPTGQKLLGGIQ